MTDAKDEAVARDLVVTGKKSHDPPHRRAEGGEGVTRDILTAHDGKVLDVTNCPYCKNGRLYSVWSSVEGILQYVECSGCQSRGAVLIVWNRIPRRRKP